MKFRVALLSALLFLSACAQGGDPQPGIQAGGQDSASGNNFSVPLPVRLQKIVTGTLTAEIVVDGGTPVSLTVSGTNVTGTVSNLSVGNHTFVINYFVAIAPAAPVLVATASATGAITAGAATAIVFAASAITYPDSDHDGFTNLAEVEIGTDPNSAASVPPSDAPRHSTNYVLADTIGISPVGGNDPLLSSTAYKVPIIANAAPDATPNTPTSATFLFGRSKSQNYSLDP